MQKGLLKKTMVAVVLACAILFALNAAAGETVNIEGKVNDNYQIVASNGQVYDIADTDMGNSLAEMYVDAKVKVTGTLEKAEESQVIVVTDFTILEE